MTADSNDDWLSAPAPPPRPIGEAAHQAKPKAQQAKPKPKSTVTPLRPLAAMAEAMDEPPIVAAPPPPPLPPPAEDLPPAEPDGGRSGGGRPHGEIWKGCPVRPLGLNGGTYYYLDIHGQLRAVTKHDAQAMMMLFGHMIPKLCYAFPQWIRDPDDSSKSIRKPLHFQHQPATVAMISACSEKGLFDPENAVRGVGAWCDDDGQLIYHTGNRLHIGATEAEPGPHQGRIYPAAPAVPHPAPAGTDTPDPVPALMEVLETWQWTRPEIDAVVTLGLIGVQMFGGALGWRPAFWITGGAGSGKSALQRLMLLLHGGEKGLIQSTDATARGIASLLGQSTLPVSLDELEPGDAGSTKERDIIQTARVAASGGRWARGSSDQKGSTGQLRSTFLFSSVLVPGVLKSQDLQRIILLSLNPFPEGARAPDMRADTWRKRGAALKRLILDRWPSWAARLELWREALAEVGIQGRDGDNWGTTMAMAQMMRSEALPTAEELAGWAAKLARLIKVDLGEAGNDADEVLVHLMSQEFDVFRRGERYTIAQWVMVAAQLDGASEALVNSLAGADTVAMGTRAKAAEVANAKLGSVLLRVISEAGQEPRLFIGHKKVQGLLDVFAGSQWAGGAWTQSLGRVPGAVPSPIPRRMAGFQSRGIEIPLSAIPGLMGLPADRDRAAPVAPSGPYHAEDFQ